MIVSVLLMLLFVVGFFCLFLFLFCNHFRDSERVIERETRKRKREGVAKEKKKPRERG